MALLDWYDANKRDLPWRRDTNPYRVWISEVMLQQTRVDTVVPHYAGWLEAFPNVKALAAADEKTVLAQWSGLGYYGRARRLHAAARIVAEHGFPTSAAGWRKLPGVGPYISAAVASICFDEPVAAIDGNLARVLSRVHGITENVDRPAGQRALRDASSVDIDRPGDWNQALMDLGATICTPVAPRCGDCPLDCIASDRGMQEDLPIKNSKRRPLREDVHFAIITKGDSVLLCRKAEGLLQGTWLPPGGDAGTPLEDHVRAQTGLVVRVDEGARDASHTFTHRIWNIRVHVAKELGGDMTAAQWVNPDSPDVALSTAARKAIAAARP